jgi:nitroreductase
MVNEIIKKRKSIRSYDTNAVITDDEIKSLLEAAMLAPSACGMRPWKFYVLQRRDIIDKITKIHPYVGMLRSANCVIVVCIDMNIKNRVSDGFYQQDAGAAIENILLQAAYMDIGTCWCGVYPKEKLVTAISELLEMPENIVPINIIAVGRPAEEFGSRGFYEEEKVVWIK